MPRPPPPPPTPAPSRRHLLVAALVLVMQRAGAAPAATVAKYAADSLTGLGETDTPISTTETAATSQEALMTTNTASSESRVGDLLEMSERVSSSPPSMQQPPPLQSSSTSSISSTQPGVVNATTKKQRRKPRIRLIKVYKKVWRKPKGRKNPSTPKPQNNAQPFSPGQNRKILPPKPSASVNITKSQTQKERDDLAQNGDKNDEEDQKNVETQLNLPSQEESPEEKVNNGKLFRRTTELSPVSSPKVQSLLSKIENPSFTVFPLSLSSVTQKGSDDAINTTDKTTVVNDKQTRRAMHDAQNGFATFTPLIEELHSTDATIDNLAEGHLIKTNVNNEHNINGKTENVNQLSSNSTTTTTTQKKSTNDSPENSTSTALEKFESTPLYDLSVVERFFDNVESEVKRIHSAPQDMNSSVVQDAQNSDEQISRKNLVVTNFSNKDDVHPTERLHLPDSDINDKSVESSSGEEISRVIPSSTESFSESDSFQRESISDSGRSRAGSLKRPPGNFMVSVKVSSHRQPNQFPATSVRTEVRRENTKISPELSSTDMSATSQYSYEDEDIGAYDNIKMSPDVGEGTPTPKPSPSGNSKILESVQLQHSSQVPSKINEGGAEKRKQGGEQQSPNLVQNLSLSGRKMENHETSTFSGKLNPSLHSDKTDKPVNTQIPSLTVSKPDNYKSNNNVDIINIPSITRDVPIFFGENKTNSTHPSQHSAQTKPMTTSRRPPLVVAKRILPGLDEKSMDMFQKTRPVLKKMIDDKSRQIPRHNTITSPDQMPYSKKYTPLPIQEIPETWPILKTRERENMPFRSKPQFEDTSPLLQPRPQWFNTPEYRPHPWISNEPEQGDGQYEPYRALPIPSFLSPPLEDIPRRFSSGFFPNLRDLPHTGSPRLHGWRPPIPGYDNPDLHLANEFPGHDRFYDDDYDDYDLIYLNEDVPGEMEANTIPWERPPIPSPLFPWRAPFSHWAPPLSPWAATWPPESPPQRAVEDDSCGLRRWFARAELPAAPHQPLQQYYG